MTIKQKRFLTASIAITLFISWILLRPVKSIEFKIFKAYDKHNAILKLVKIIPASYRNRFDIEEIESRGEDLVVLNVTDKLSPTHANFVILRKQGEDIFLKAYPFMFKDGREQTGDFKNQDAKFIDVKAFNLYLSVDEHTIEEVKYKYCYFLSSLKDNSSFLILSKPEEIDSLKSARKDMTSFLKHFPSYELLNKEQIEFPQSNNEIVCWFMNKGVVRFKFYFNPDKSVKQVESEVIGFLGIEAPSV
ncbi:MAG TPA: hypothetical protein VIN08_16920 [Ohtaekwangia sp.]|uniref:hypothetical protein n=1 Tax=Ohtaekwangia sp. TaxID=2066019 RepID=UPI002F956B30